MIIDPKKHNRIQLSDVVLIGNEDKKRLHWPLAKVNELFSSKDGIIRLVKNIQKNFIKTIAFRGHQKTLVYER